MARESVVRHNINAHALNIADVGAEIWAFFFFFVRSVLVLFHIFSKRGAAQKSHHSVECHENLFSNGKRTRDSDCCCSLVLDYIDFQGKSRLIYFRHDLLILYLVFPLALSLSHCVCVFGQYKKYLFRIRMGRIYQARINVNGTILNVWIACAVMSSEHSLDSGWLEWTGTTPFTVILSRMLENANECKKTCCKYFIAADRN